MAEGLLRSPHISEFLSCGNSYVVGVAVEERVNRLEKIYGLLGHLGNVAKSQNCEGS